MKPRGLRHLLAGARRRLLGYLPGALSGWYLLGLLVRLTVRDHFLLSATVFYAAQPVVLAALAAAAAGMWHRQRRRRAALACWAVAGACAGWWLATAFSWHSAKEDSAAVRALVWNVAGGRLGWPAIARTIRAHNPDVAVLVEAWPPVGQMTGSLRETLPEFRWSSCAGGLLVLVRGEMESAHYGQLDGGGKFRVCQLTLAGTPLTVVAVDMPNSFNRFRRVPLEALAELVEPLADKPLLVLGDFNTPPDSVHFAHLREVLVNAYEVAGRGYGPTWPVPCPVLTLDQAWASDTIRVLSCRAFWTPYSDHRPLLVSFTPRPSAPAGKN